MLEIPNPDVLVTPNGRPAARYRYVHAPRYQWVHLRAPYEGFSADMLMNPAMSLRGLVMTVTGMVETLPKLIRSWTLEDEQGQVRPITVAVVGEFDDDVIEALVLAWQAAREAPKATASS